LFSLLASRLKPSPGYPDNCNRIPGSTQRLYCSEAEEAASKGDRKSLYRIVKELTGQRMQSQQIKMADGRFARTHDELVNRWKDHFQAVLNCPEPTTALHHHIFV